VPTNSCTDGPKDFPNPAVPFTDLGADDPSSLYPHEYVAVCALNNITKGKSASAFDPGSKISRRQMITMVVRAADNLAAGTLKPTPDGWVGILDASDATHGANIAKAESNGLLNGIRASSSAAGLAGWDTSQNATRGEVAQMLWNLLNLMKPAEVWIYVDGSGDYPTIDAAVAAVAAGTTVHLGPGEFKLRQRIAVNSSLNLIGSGMDGASKTTLTCSGPVLEVDSATFSVQDIRFVCTAAGGAVNVMDVDDGVVDVARCYFTGGRKWTTAGDGLCLHGTTTATVKDSIFTSNGGYGILADDQANVILDHNTCTSNGESGIGGQGNAAMVVTNNTCSENKYDGVYLHDNASGTVRGNTCLNHQYCGICCSDDAHAVVEDNVCHDDYGGIYFEGRTTGTIQKNECHHCHWGIWKGPDATPTIGENNLHDNTINLETH
jgi:parallel beta-helix repeat protein